MEDNNKEVINTEQAGSGGLLYGTESQPQEEAAGTSAVYGTMLQTELAQQDNVQGSSESHPVSAQLSKNTDTVQISSGTTDTAEAPSVPVQLSKTTESAEDAPILVPIQGTDESVENQMQPVPVQLSKSPELTSGQPVPTQPSDADVHSVPIQPSSATAQPIQIPSAGPTSPDGSAQPQGAFYQQGGSQPTNNPPMGFGPVQMPPPIQGAPAPKPKKRRSGLVAGILCAAAVVIVIAIGVLLSKALFGGGGAKTQLAKGFANMAKEMAAYHSSVAEDIGLTAINKIKAEKPIHTNIDVSFTDPNAKGSFNSLDLEIDAVSDFRKKMGQYEISAGTYGFDMNIGNIVAADNTLYISVPIVFKDKTYSLDLTNLGRDFNNSAWSELLGEKIPEEYAITLFENPNTAANIKDVGRDSELYNIIYKHSRIIANAMTFDKIKDRKTFTFDGTDVAYGGVRLTVGKDAYNEVAEGIRDDILASDFYDESKKRYQSIYGISYGEDLDTIVRNMFDLRLEQDMVLDFYLDKKGRIVNISTPEDIAVYGEYSDIDSMAVDIDFSGSVRTLDTIDGGLYMQDGDEIVYLGIQREASVTNEYYTEDLTFSIQGNASDEEITFWYTNEWGYEDKTFDMQMTLEADDNRIGLRADGSFMDIIKDEGYTFQIDHAAISSDEGDLLLMTGSILTEVTENKIEVPQNADNFLEMTSSDIQKLFYGALF